VPLAETADLLAFRTGSLVYVGTFVIGNSFDYRLVFLLLTLPLLLRWPAPPRAAGNRLNLPLVTVAIVMLALWIGTLSQQLRLADELVSWTLAGLLLLLLVRSAPQIGAVFQSGRASR
jgi:hypothetical protein